MASSSMASAAPRGFMAAPATASSGPTKFTLISMPCSSNTRNLRLIVRATNEGAPVGEEAILDAEDAAVDSLPAAEAKASPVGPAKGSKVRILRKESYWYKGVGRVVTVDKDPKSRYPVVVRFQKANYANVSSNNYALDEIELVPVP